MMGISKSVKAFWNRLDAWTILKFTSLANRMVDALPFTSEVEKEEIRPVYLNIMTPIIRALVKGGSIAFKILSPLGLLLFLLMVVLPRVGFEVMAVILLFGIAFTLGMILDKMPENKF